MSIKDQRTYSYTLAAGDQFPIEKAGRFIACLEATALFELSVDDNPPREFERGLKTLLPVEADDFSRVMIHNTSASANTIKLVIGHGDFFDSRLTSSGTIDISPPGALVDHPDVSCLATANTAVLAANATRRTATVQLDPGAANNVRVGLVAAAATGSELTPGGFWSADTTSAISVYNPGGAAVSVRVSEVLA